MIVKILGFFDLIAAALFWAFGFFGLFASIIIIVPFYLVAKGAVFLISKDIASIIDIIAGVVIFASMSFALPKLVVAIIVVYLAQKAVFSLLA